MKGTKGSKEKKTKQKKKKPTRISTRPISHQRSSIPSPLEMLPHLILQLKQCLWRLDLEARVSRMCLVWDVIGGKRQMDLLALWGYVEPDLVSGLVS